MKLTTFLLLGLALQAEPAPAVASAIVEAVQEGPASFTLRGTGLVDVAAIELGMSYDRAAFSNPRIVQGPVLAGSMTAVNPNSPGVIRIAAIASRPFPSSGVIATISFDATGAAGAVSFHSARIASLGGAALPLVSRIVPQAQDQAAPPPSSDKTSTGRLLPSQTAPASPPVLVAPIAIGPLTGSSVTTAATATGLHRDTPASTATAISARPEVLTASRQPAPVQQQVPADSKSRKSYTWQSVLDRFREYRGERTPQALSALFAQDGAIGFRQEPTVALADGRIKVTLTFVASDDQRGSPDIAVMGARQLSLTRDPEATNTWRAELLPEQNTLKATMTIPLKDIFLVVPIITVPRVEDLWRGKVTEADFQVFLHERGSKERPKFDLNKDGRRDYIDDYIYTANYLLVSGGGKGK